MRKSSLFVRRNGRDYSGHLFNFSSFLRCQHAENVAGNTIKAQSFLAVRVLDVSPYSGPLLVDIIEVLGQIPQIPVI